jgi:hypothetical protein
MRVPWQLKISGKLGIDNICCLRHSMPNLGYTENMLVLVYFLLVRYVYPKFVLYNDFSDMRRNLTSFSIYLLWRIMKKLITMLMILLTFNVFAEPQIECISIAPNRAVCSIIEGERRGCVMVDTKLEKILGPIACVDYDIIKRQMSQYMR